MLAISITPLFLHVSAAIGIHFSPVTPGHSRCRDDCNRERFYFLRVMTLVIACLMTTPAFSISFLVRPFVTQTLIAGCGCHPCDVGVTPSACGIAFRRVTRTSFRRHCLLVSWTHSTTQV